MREKKTIRINKYLSEIGYCSRRAADKLIEQGRITINGKIAVMGIKILDEDEIRINGKLVAHPEKKMVYIAFNIFLLFIVITTRARLRARLRA